jgi:magnesium chelatase family protein
MSLTQLITRAQLGISAPEVCVEVHISGGLPAFTVVGLPETTVREARDRVRSAIINSGFEFPARRITVNLAPADLPKEGGRYDLSIALGILAAWPRRARSTSPRCGMSPVSENSH